MQAVRVAVLGNLSLDLVEDTQPRPGGPPLYAARAFAALGVPALVRVKAATADRSHLQPALEGVGLPVEWLSGTSTATYEFSYEGDVRRMHVHELGSPWTPDEVDGLDAGWVHVGALYRGEFPPETLAALAESGARISFDAQGLVRPARTGPLVLEPDPDTSFLRHVSVLKLSDEEARALVGSLEERALSELGGPEVVVTLGSRGSLVVAGQRLVHVPAEPVDADPTGAGDAFAAAYVVERNRGLAPERAAENATSLVHRLLARAQ
jgi:sugar/nucleoside kinase (ribokinase family)